MKIKIRPRLNAEMVNEAHRLGLDFSRILEKALIREIEMERRRRQAELDQDHEGGDGAGPGTTAS